MQEGEIRKNKVTDCNLPPQGIEMFHRLTNIHHICCEHHECSACPLVSACVRAGAWPVKIPVSIFPCEWSRGDRRLIVRRLLHLE